MATYCYDVSLTANALISKSLKNPLNGKTRYSELEVSSTKLAKPLLLAVRNQLEVV